MVNALQNESTLARYYVKYEQMGGWEMVKEKYSRYRMLFLLHLLLSAILKGPFDNIGLRRGTLDKTALVDLGPEVVEVL